MNPTDLGFPVVDTGLDIQRVRAAFPALDRVEAGHPVGYFDGPGGTQVPRRVIDAVSGYLAHHNANTHWEYESSRETDRLLTQARQRFGRFLGCDPEEVVFGANMTSLTFHLSRALGRGMGPGDEIVVTELDHHANIAPWTALTAERGVTVRRAPFAPETGTFEAGAVEALIGPKTRLVAIGRASNALGTINDLDSVIEMAHANGALVFVDAVHSAAHERTNVRALGCDFLACSPYKFYGPHLGVLFGRRELIEGLDTPKLDPSPNHAPERLETGTLPHESVVGAGEAVGFLADLGGVGSDGDPLDRAFELLHARGEELFERMWEGLGRIAGVSLFGPPPGAPRTPTLGFSVAGVPSGQVARRLSNEHGLFLSHGDFYAATVVERLGLGPEGLVRAGAACYTTEEEVDRLVGGVGVIAASV